jgi:phosphatidylethanolamine-binding protein (PEBP) family uncharacterized protein
MYDPDAPTGSGFGIGLFFDIPANVNELVKKRWKRFAKLSAKGAIQSITDYGIKGFGGPCPPEGHGYHEYIITVFCFKNR